MNIFPLIYANKPFHVCRKHFLNSSAALISLILLESNSKRGWKWKLRLLAWKDTCLNFSLVWLCGSVRSVFFFLFLNLNYFFSVRVENCFEAKEIAGKLCYGKIRLNKSFVLNFSKWNNSWIQKLTRKYIQSWYLWTNSSRVLSYRFF